MAQEYDGIWPGPKGPTVWEQELRNGLRRIVEAGQDVPRGPGPAGGPKKAFASLQDIVAGTAQALSSPITGLLSPFAPAADAALNAKIKFGPPKANPERGVRETSLRDLLDTYDEKVVQPIAEEFDYGGTRASELGLAGLASLVGLGTGRLGKLLPEGPVALPRNPDGSLSNQAGTFIFADQTRHHPKLEDSWVDAKNTLQDELSRFRAKNPYYMDESLRDRLDIESPIREAVRKLTGWEENPVTGLLRYEVSDKDFGLRDGLTIRDLMGILQSDSSPRTVLPFRAFAKHPELEKIDPTLLDLAIMFHKQEQGGSFAALTPGDSRSLVRTVPESLSPAITQSPRALITIGLKPFRSGVKYSPELAPQVSRGDLLDILLHEIQHNIQHKSIGASFGAESSWPQYWETAGEVEARLAERRRRLGQEDRQKFSPSAFNQLFSQDVPYAQQILDPRTQSSGLLGWPAYDPKWRKKKEF